MRPEILYPLFAPLTDLKGVGKHIAALLEKLTGSGHVAGLLWHLPTGRIDRRASPTIAEVLPGQVATLTVRVDRHFPAGRSRMPYKVLCSDGTGRLTLVFFNARPDYLGSILPEGTVRVVSGKTDVFGGEIQMTHPDHIVSEDEAASVRVVEPVYPLTTGLTPKVAGKAIRAALERAPRLPEWIDGPLLQARGWPDWRTAVAEAHAPVDESDLDPGHPARQRLAYDELLANQLALMMVRSTMRKRAGRPVAGDGSLRRKTVAALPFSLTASQTRAVEEITADMAGEAQMLRLLQGDVGSGKTVVAALAMLSAVEAGCQAALMAPTEILARQHHATLSRLAQAAGVPCVLLTGREKGKARTEALAALAAGEAPLVVGTHALFQDDVAFRDLALAVIDEQHRFGVHQRLMLARKGRAADVLVMTATPIPRTLMLTAYGDMESSKLTERLPGRLPIDTRVLPVERLDQVVDAVARTIAGGAKVYWVCPLVEESEATDLAAAEQRFAHLQERFGSRVGLVHGRMKGPEKDAVMAAFATGPIDLLVATTVIEVGVDVADAAVMVIEHAERFGLAQLHQLRGRVGRGERPSTCLLLYTQPLSESARSRLAVIRETEDGFRIAEEDLRLRGAGELLGTRQSGMPDFRLADLAVHGELLAIARDDAGNALARNPGLSGARGDALRTLLYLFERDAAVRLLQSG